MNYYLAYRLVVVDELHERKRTLAQTAFIVYTGSLAINWTYQLYIILSWILVFPAWGLYIYIILLYFIIVDDIILARFLWNEMFKSIETKQNIEQSIETPEDPINNLDVNGGRPIDE